MMLVWLGGLLLGLRGVWPLLQQPALTPDLVIAFNFGRQRFWRR